EVCRIHEVPPDYKPNPGESMKFYAPEHRPALEWAMRKAVEHGKPWDLELQLTTAKGKTLWIRTIGKARRENGKTVRLSGSVQDINERKLTEESLLKAREKWEQTFDAVPDLVAILDKNHRITQVNKAMADRLGLLPEMCIGQACHASVHGTDHPPSFCPHSQLLKDGREHVSEVHEECLGGHFIVTASPIFDEDGELTGSVHIARDINERKKVEEKLRRGEQRYRELVQNANSIILRVTPEWKITFLNDFAREFFGYTGNEILGRSVVGTIVPETESTGRNLATLMDDIAQHPEKYRYNENENMRSSGERVWVAWTNKLLKDRDGRILELLCIGNDITDKRRSEEAVRKANDELKVRVDELSMLNSIARTMTTMPDLKTALEIVTRKIGQLVNAGGVNIALFDDARRKLTVFARYTAYRQGPDLMNCEMPKSPGLEEVLRTGRSLIIPRAQTNRLLEPVHELMRVRGVTCVMIVPLRVSDKIIGALSLSTDQGNRGFTENEMRLAETVAGQISGAIENARLFEEARRSGKEAEAANRAKSEFLAKMSHEIRTPMNAVIGLSHLALQTELTGKQQDYLTKVHSSAHSLLGLINDILDFSRIEAGKLEMESVNFNLEDVFGNISDLMGIQAEEKGIDLLFSLPGDVPCSLVGDPLRLRQILTNLTGNAVKFTETGEVLVSVETVRKNPGNALLRFSVRDSGIGLTPEQISGLFRPFSQADGSVTRNYGGSGLGLAICKRLTEMMGGEISVESDTGRGSVFMFTAKFGRQPEEEKKRPVTPEDLRGVRVLVADDNMIERDIMKKILSSFSFEVTAAASGREALTLIEDASEERPYQLAILDWKMPGPDGIEITKRIRRNPRLSRIPGIILLTAHSRKEMMYQAEKAGADAFLMKPVEPSVLFDTIMNIFGKKANSESRPEKRKIRASEALKRIRGARILLVEDNKINQQVAAGLLENAGMTVEVANNGREGVAAVAASDYDLVLMDIQMPELDGYEATREIRRREKEWEARDSVHLPIVAMTAHAMTGERERCLEVGMDDYVSKPIDPDHLFSVLLRRIKPGERETPVPGHKKTGEEGDAAFPKTLPGIDTESALRRVGGNRKLYRKLLTEFYDDYAGAADAVREARDRGDAGDARQMVHTLKGVAGNMGAGELYAAAGELESAIMKNRDENRDVLMCRLEKSLNQVLQSVGTLKKTEESGTGERWQGTDGRGQWDISEAKALLTELADLIREGDAEALEHTDNLKNYLGGSGADEQILLLKEQLNSYDFEDAQETLTEIISFLNIF
ncbi:response regulator, partial [Desulfobacterales bacterium HSG2]|nr:response regulator [Desulfobacterales bacterium HSG2]